MGQAIRSIVENEQYISGRSAEKMLGLTRKSFVKLAKQALFGTVEYPGLGVRYRRADVEALIARSRKPAAGKAVAS